MRRLTTEEFIEKATRVHGSNYDYSLTEYKKSSEKVKISCGRHGVWMQRPNDHLTGNGCPGCKFEKLATMKRCTAEEFVNKARAVHGNAYEYSKVAYVNATTKVTITCNIHGDFEQTPDKHTAAGCGCPQCSNSISKGEKRIMQWLAAHNIRFEREKKFDDLRGKTANSRLRFDFFLPEYSTLIEFDGHQHFSPVRIKGRLTEEQAAIEFLRTVRNDHKKTSYARECGLGLIRIRFDDDVEATLQHTLALEDKVEQ